MSHSKVSYLTPAQIPRSTLRLIAFTISPFYIAVKSTTKINQYPNSF
nr:MAG TPA: hypothetical protein [Caudoviricetes sp.]